MSPEPVEQWPEKRWTMLVCPIHGPVTNGQNCRVVVKRRGAHVRYCHGEQPVAVVPASRIEGLVEALEFYADLQNYQDGDNEEIPGFAEADVNDDWVWTADGGHVARRALAAFKGEQSS
jgi:hypothetical protein